MCVILGEDEEAGAEGKGEEEAGGGQAQAGVGGEGEEEAGD